MTRMHRAPTGARAIARAASATLFLLVASPAQAERPPLRMARPVEAAEGWARVELPDDVLDACRPGLPDLRLLRADGSEVAFTRGARLASMPSEVPLVDVESGPLETTALIDRGARPGLAERLTLVVPDEAFLKPIVVEASDDRATWAEIARGSIFALAPRVGGARMTTLHFAPSDRRYLRLRLDDRNGAAVHPRTAIVGDAARGPDPQERPLDARLVRSDDASVATYTVILPIANLPLIALRVIMEDSAFVRRVRVYERVIFRDEVARRLVGEGTIFRSAAQREQDAIFVSDVAGRVLEIEVDHAGSPPTKLARVAGRTVPQEILFHAPAGGRLELAYGSASLAAPSYDLASALALGRPTATRAATLGAPIETGAREAPVAPPPRGAPLDVSAWKRRASIVLPASGTVAYVDLDPSMAGRDADVRIVDAEKRAVPYVFERTPRHVRREPHVEVAERGPLTVLTLSELGAPRAIGAIELVAKGPAYFARDVSVWEEERDARGVTGRRLLGGAHWERRAGEPPLPLRVPVSGITATAKALDVEIDNGDNPPLVLGPVSAEAALRRLDFVFEPGDVLTLLGDNPRASAPHYDLALVADAVLAAPAQPARLELQPELDPAGAPPRAKGPTPPWFWGAVVAAGILVALALARSLTKADGSSDGGGASG